MAETKTTLHIEDEMRSSFLDYAMSVIIARALPDVRDGLKPVHRRVLYAMQQLKNTHAQPYKKSARVVGDVIGKYHPHGDQSVYDALVRLAQDFAMRYPLVDGQGNFGSIDGDSPAAMRYTEVRMQKLTSEMLADLDKQTVDWVPNYDEKELEPSVLPTKVPNLLLNGAVGIAVGMATNIPPHNLSELIDATLALIDEPKPGAVGVLQLLDHVKGPDFPTGGIILGTAGIKQAYTSGRGNVTVRARCEIEVDDKGREAIVVSEIPYQVNKTRLIERIAELVREKKIEGISDVQDYSDRRGMRIWIQVKKDAVAQIVLNKLYKMSDLQTSFGVNMIAIVNGRPEVLNLEKCLRHFIDHRRTIVTRRCRFDLHKAMERREIVEGLGVAIDAIDRIIELIRTSRDPDQAKGRLCAEPLMGHAGFLERCGRPAEEIERAKQGPYRLSERQAKAILDMRLQRLTGLEQEKIEGEFKELCALIAELEAILTDPKKLMAVIRGELLAIRHEYGDPEGQTAGTGGGGKGSRRTEIVPDEDEIQPIDLVADESMVVAITRGGYVKRMPTTEYRVQARGGVGLNAGTTRDDDDQVIELFEASAHAWILLFTNTGRVFRKRVFEFPLGTRGQRPKALVNFLELKEGEQVLEMVPYREDEVDDDHFVVLASREGYIKRTSLAEFANIRASGLIAASVAEGDDLIDAKLTNGNCDIVMVSRAGQAIRFAEDQVRPMGRTARGVKGMGLRKGDEVVNILVHDRSEPEDEITFLTVCEHGYGKRTAAAEYGAQNRSGLGLKAIKASKRNGKVVGMVKVREADQLMVVTTGGKIIRTPVAGISVLGRATQGVRLIRLAEGETVSGLARIDDAQAGELVEAESFEAEEGEETEEADETEELDEGEEGDEGEGEGEGEGDEGESEDDE